MKAISADALTERENYKLLIGSIIPRPIAFVTTLSNKGVLNGAPFSYFNVITANPPMISVAIQRKGGVQKDTSRNAIEKNAFVVHIVDESIIEAVNQTSASLPTDQSEVEAAGLTAVNSSIIDIPGIKEAKVRMECRLERVVSLGEGDAMCDLLIG